MQIRAEHVKEPVRGRDDPVMAALALHHRQPPVRPSALARYLDERVSNMNEG
jgi:hypothetical protein